MSIGILSPPPLHKSDRHISNQNKYLLMYTDAYFAESLETMTGVYHTHHNQGLIQPKNDSGYRFRARKVFRPNSTFLAHLCCQKQLKTRSAIKNGIILILKSVLKERT